MLAAVEQEPAEADEVTVKYSPKHAAFLSFWAPPGQITIKCAFGVFGSGKTYVTADAFLELVAMHPDSLPGFSPEHPPRSIICGASYGGLLDGPVAELHQMAPPGWIVKEVLYGSNPYIQWANGHVTLLYTAKMLNPRRGGRGPSVCFFWINEVQDDAYDEGTLKNAFNRVRHAGAIRPTVLVEGVARRGTAIEGYIRGKRSESLNYWILDLEDNAHNLTPGMLAMIRSTIPASARRRDPEGWELGPEDSIWASFSDANIDGRDLTPLVTRPRHLGIDLRTHAAVVAAIEVEIAPGAKGLLVTEQMMLDHQSAEKIANEIDRRGWVIGPGSTVTHDPTLAEDEVNHLRFRTMPDGRRLPRWPGAQIIAHRAGPLHEERNGLRVVDVAIQDAADVRRLLVHKNLEVDQSRRGVVNALRAYDGWRHSPLAHAADAIRYLCCTKIPIADLVPQGGSLGGGGLKRANAPFAVPRR